MQENCEAVDILLDYPLINEYWPIGSGKVIRKFNYGKRPCGEKRLDELIAWNQKIVNPPDRYKVLRGIPFS
jgi:hypothetical protein